MLHSRVGRRLVCIKWWGSSPRWPWEWRGRDCGGRGRRGHGGRGTRGDAAARLRRAATHIAALPDAQRAARRLARPQPGLLLELPQRGGGQRAVGVVDAAARQHPRAREGAHRPRSPRQQQAAPRVERERNGREPRQRGGADTVVGGHRARALGRVLVAERQRAHAARPRARAVVRPQRHASAGLAEADRDGSGDDGRVEAEQAAEPAHHAAALARRVDRQPRHHGRREQVLLTKILCAKGA